ncbi:hypothetical protein HKX48_006541 [Thoreauomyces humboldtii]|nr:hypothetical protein HKX48_006541 [Thoreauomyces humboldtii]
MTLQISDYLDSYLQLCEDEDVFVVPSLKRVLQNAVDGGQVPDTFRLNGTQSDLSHTRLTDTYVNILLKPLGPCGVVLREFDLSCNEIGDDGAVALAAFVKVWKQSNPWATIQNLTFSRVVQDDTALETLNLRANNIGPVGVVALAKALHINERLLKLDISGNNVGSEGGMEIANMLQLNSSLEHLHMANCRLTATPLIALSTVLRNNTTLIGLDISNNFSNTGPHSVSVTADIQRHLTLMLECNFSLVQIRCGKMRVNDADVVECWQRALKSNLRITDLDLSSNNITRDGGTGLSRALHNHPSLITLTLSCCSIQDEGAEAIALMLQNNFTLQSLHIDYNGITGKGLTAVAKAITQNMALKKIRVWGNKWDVASCEVGKQLLGSG